MEARLPRKLAAILYADVAGYSRLTSEDEEGTHRRLSDYLNVFSAAIEQHQGRVVHYAGDAVLADFPTVSDALACAAEVQAALEELNRDLPDGRKLEFRIGVNLGEVIIDRNDIYGDGVNVAARLEGLADAGGICISGTVYDAVGARFPLVYQYLGEQTVKNIKHAVRAYRVLVGERQEREPAAGAKPALEPADRPSIAVLPFANLGGDAEQEYFADGITEDIITGLSRYRELLVIARGSAFALKNDPVEVTEAAARLGVEYVLKGSVRKAGDRVRVSVQLVEAREGRPIWAERYDRVLEDVFAVQDDITQRIICTLVTRLEDSVRKRALRKGDVNLSAYDCLLRGKQYFDDFHCDNQEDNLRARKLFEQAIALDPGYGTAYACLAATYLTEFEQGWTETPEAAGDRAIDLARKAIELDDLESNARLILAAAYFRVKADLKLAKTQIQKAIELNPNDYWNYCFKCWFSACTGELEEGIFCGHEAVRRNPFLTDSCLRNVGIAEYFAGRYEDAIATFSKLADPGPAIHACIAAAYAQLGCEADAASAADEFRQRAGEIGLEPENDRETWNTFWTSRQFKDQTSIDHLIDGFRKAGLST